MYKAFFLSLLAFVIAAHAAATLDAATLAQNAKDAQGKNRSFLDLKPSSSCEDGQIVCMGNTTLAECKGASWHTSRCPRSLKCFAMPSVRAQGTIVSCTSERHAEGIIAACGATGGILGNPDDVGGGAAGGNTTSQSGASTSSTSDTETNSITQTSIDPSPTTAPQGSAIASSSAPGTSTVAPDPQLTPTPMPGIPNLTVPPSEFSSIISSAEAAGDSVITIVANI